MQSTARYFRDFFPGKTREVKGRGRRNKYRVSGSYRLPTLDLIMTILAQRRAIIVFSREFAPGRRNISCRFIWQPTGRRLTIALEFLFFYGEGTLRITSPSCLFSWIINGPIFPTAEITLILYTYISHQSCTHIYQSCIFGTLAFNMLVFYFCNLKFDYFLTR